jgi:hypothetical protein
MPASWERMWVVSNDDERDDNKDGLFDEGMDNEPDVVPMLSLGLPLDCAGTADFGQPTELIVIVKVIQAGEFGYRMVSTPDLQSVEAMGMIRWAQLLLEEGILTQARLPEDEDYDDADQGGDEESEDE